MWFRALVAAMALGVSGLVIADAGRVIEATTAAGEAVRLLPNGRWEFVDAARQAAAQAVADTYPENQLCPPGAQGRVFGIGRCILPGDPNYNRGSRSPRTR